MSNFKVVFDEKSCWGCRACEVACKQEKNPFSYDAYSPEKPDSTCCLSVRADGPKEVNGALDFTWRITICKHCDDPPCAEACPEEAIMKDPATGIVLLDKEKCIGCGLCAEACPYDAIVINESTGKASKCDLCYNRVINGLIPACADNVCLAHCVYFGDEKDIDGMMKEKPWLKHRIEGTLGSMVINVEE